MIIVLDDYGLSLEKEDGCFLLSHEKGIRKISPKRITAIHIVKPCTLSSPAVVLAAQFQIPVLFFSSSAKPVARLWNTEFGSTVAIRHAQMQYCRSAEAMHWVHQNLDLKIQGQITILKFLANRIPRLKKELAGRINELAIIIQETLDERTMDKQGFFVAEARLGRIYWETLAVSMEHYLPFTSRSRRPAQDEFNALINYGYGMLYSIVETATITAGLDPHIGILHAEEYDRPSFVFDAIEPFRPWVDALIVKLAMQKQFNTSHFEKNKKGVLLAKEGRKKFIPLWYGMMNERTLFTGRKIKRKDQVQHRLTSLAQQLLEKK